MRKDISAVLFDLDGTLIDSAPDLGAAIDKMRTDRFMPSFPLSVYRPMAGAGARGMIAVAFGLSPEDDGFEALKEEFFFNYEARLVKNTYAFDGVSELIECICTSGLKWGVVTNKSARFTLPIVRAMSVFATAQTIISGDTTKHAKPHPAPLLEAARQLDLPATRCIFVGDDERDIVAGRSAAMPTVAAAYGYLGQKNDIKNWNADFTICKPLELLNFLEMT